MQSLMTRGREIPVETRRSRILPARPPYAAMVQKARAEDNAVAAMFAVQQKDEPASAVSQPMPSAVETEHEKVFRLVGEKKFRDAARIAKRLIDAGDVEGFCIYRDTPKLRLARIWLEEQTSLAKQTEQAGWHKITPERAQVLIEANPDNRIINADGLEDRLRDMHDGAWAKNGESLIVSKCSHLNDGQHRCWAGLLLGVQFTTAVSWGVERWTRNTVNMGVVRKGADRLGFDGVSDPTGKSAIALLAHMIFLGRKPTKREEQEFYHANSMLIDRAHHVVKTTVRGSSIATFRVAAMHLIRLGASDEDLTEFFKAVRRGDKTRERGCPAFALYKGIAVIKEKHTRPEWVAAICQHFLAWKANKPLGTVEVPRALPAGRAA